MGFPTETKDYYHLQKNPKTSVETMITMQCIWTHIFSKILRQVPTRNAGGDSDAGIQKVLLFLRMHFRENPCLGEAAKIAHYNSSHFSTTFHKQIGMPYNAYLNLLKISYAKELLLSTGLKIAEICFECGFSSQSNFLRIFKEQTGLTPSQFRRKSTECWIEKTLLLW